jgi:lysophospholipase L1-like esterase
LTRRRLAAYGHSWVVGQGASRAERGLVDIAAFLLGMEAKNLGVSGSSGIQTAALIRRQGAVRADAYLVLIGLNDARRHGLDPVALDAYTEALEEVVDSCAAAVTGTPVLLVLQPRLLDYRRHPPHNIGSTAAVAAHNERMRQVTGRHVHAVGVDVTEWDARSMLDADTVHPNDLGHASIGAAVARAYQAWSIGRTSPVHD